MSIKYLHFDRDFDKIQSIVESYLPDPVKKLLQDGISHAIKEIIMEIPYVDKDFRGTYYNDFSKRFIDISRDCIRLHLFFEKGSVTSNNYAGFVTLRDTKRFTIGRSYLNPRAVISYSDDYYCLATYKSQLKGVDLSVKAFPWMQQDGNVSRCAHIAAWSVIRYFSQKKSFYAEAALSEIINYPLSSTRKSPSKGLTIDQISQILLANKFAPEVYFKEHLSSTEFCNLIYLFIESGIPLIAGYEKHAIVIMGHENIDKLPVKTRTRTGIIDFSEIPRKLIVSDDNCLPYSKEIKSSKKRIEDIEVIIAPFYEKMYVDAIFFWKILSKLEHKLDLLQAKSLLIRRCFITSSRYFKRFIFNKGIDPAYKDAMLTMQMPHYIWVAEYSTFEEFDDRKISHRIILDGTMLRFHDEDLFLNIKKDDTLRISYKDGEQRTCPLTNKAEQMFTYNLERAQ